jgi:hypothetical protein
LFRDACLLSRFPNRQRYPACHLAHVFKLRI